MKQWVHWKERSFRIVDLGLTIEILLDIILIMWRSDYVLG